MEVLTDTYFPSLQDIHKAATTIKGISIETPLMRSHTYSRYFESNIFLKREDLQIVRSYKIRGAYNKIISLSELEVSNGVVCASAGNHAQGVAFSCKKLKIKGTIFMPNPTSSQKVAQVKMFGENFVEVILVGDTFDDAKSEALDYCDKNGIPFIHPFDDPKIIEGQATIGLEIDRDIDRPIDYLFLPIGGGGVASGVSTVFRQLSPNTKIIGVEPKGAAAMHLSIQRGQNTELEKLDRFVDGAAVRRVGDLTFKICKQNLDDIILVDEGKICEVILDVYNKDAIVLEPAGALALAALTYCREKIKGKTVVCLLGGGNNDITRMEEIKERAMLYNGLKHYFLVRFPQRSGALKEFVTDVLGPSDDIAHFEYVKKNSREKGYAVVGIELKKKEDFGPLEERMKELNFFGDYLNDKESLMDVLV